MNVCTYSPVKIWDEKGINARFSTLFKQSCFLSAYVQQYQVYSGFFTQTGTSAPAVTTAQNNVGDIVWSFSTTGIFIGTLPNGFINLSIPAQTIVYSIETDLIKYATLYKQDDSTVILETRNKVQELANDLLDNSYLSFKFIKQ